MERTYIKVSVTIDLEVDLDGWRDEYGVGGTVAELKEDVVDYITGEVGGHMHTDSGLWRNVMRRVRRNSARARVTKQY